MNSAPRREQSRNKRLNSPNGTSSRGRTDGAKLRERLEMLRLEERESSEAAGNEERLDDIRREAEEIERRLHEVSRKRHLNSIGQRKKSLVG